MKSVQQGVYCTIAVNVLEKATVTNVISLMSTVSSVPACVQCYLPAPI